MLQNTNVCTKTRMPEQFKSLIVGGVCSNCRLQHVVDVYGNAIAAATLSVTAMKRPPGTFIMASVYLVLQCVSVNDCNLTAAVVQVSG